MKRLIIIASVVVLIALLVVWRISFRDAEISVKSDKTNFEITAIDLVQEFSSDETAANTKYLNKVIEVSGRVAKVEDIEDGFNVYLQEPDHLSGVICGFNPEVAQKEDFILDEIIKVKGLCTGYLFDVVFVKCVLLK
jgi:hypothetical protein